MNKKLLTGIVALLCCCMTASATNTQMAADSTKNKTKQELEIRTEVYDHMTHDFVDSVRAELLSARDSSFIDSVKVEVWNNWVNGKIDKCTHLHTVISEPGSYILRVAANNYTTQYVPFEIKKIYKNENQRQLKPVYLRHVKKLNEEELDEIVVEATKLKFYMDGDTLVYDADAFPMTDGSMLSDLIKKLPGVQLEKGGVITVNGKKIDAMLLNGKDFFNEDRELLLDNMPAYMVKSLNTYERVPESAQNSVRAKTTEKEMVMDVKLKKDYNEGWIVTAEGGGGATFYKNDDGRHDAKYLGRLFAMRFTKKSRLIMCGTTNNVNDTREPGADGNWSELRQTQGLTSNVMGNVNYSRYFAERTRYEGSLKSTYYDITNANNTSTTTFLEGGDHYDRSSYAKRSYEWDITFNNRYVTRNEFAESNLLKQLYFHINPFFYYKKWRNHEEAASMELAKDVASNLGKAWLDSIYAPLACETLKRYAINRDVTANRGIGHWYDSHNFLTFGFTPAHNDKMAFTLDVNHRLTEDQNDIYEHDYIDYPNAEPAKASQFFNRYEPSLERNHNIRTDLRMEFIAMKDSYLGTGVAHYYEHLNTNSPLYQLNMLEGWGTRDTEHTLGNLPSMDEWLATMDMRNSSHKISDKNIFTPYVTFSYNHTNDSTKVNYYAYINVSTDFVREEMDYERGNVLKANPSRNASTWNVSMEVERRKSGTSNYQSISMRFSESLPSLTTILDIRDDSNPLNITLGNPNLKRTRYYNASYYMRHKVGRSLMYGGAGVGISENAVAQGFVVNDLGVRTTKPENVNGNWSTNANIGIDVPLDRNEKLRLSNSIKYKFNNNVDLVGTTKNDSVAKRSVVKNNILSDDLNLRWQPTKKMEYGLFGSINMQRSTSSRKGFNNIEAYTFEYGCRMQIELPYSFNVSSDLTVYSRRGYDDDAMNTNELVWNARVSKRVCKGKLTIMFDGFDILGNLSNVYRNVNGQGRIERFYNVIPSYGLLRLVYRFNKQPRKS